MSPARRILRIAPEWAEYLDLTAPVTEIVVPIADKDWPMALTWPPGTEINVVVGDEICLPGFISGRLDDRRAVLAVI